MVAEYITGSAFCRYRSLYQVRWVLSAFFRFVNEEGIHSLESVNPKTISQFRVWAAKRGTCKAPSDMSVISVFFQWAIAEGRFHDSNPVVRGIHYPRVGRRLPRPLEEDELEFAWQLLCERGSARLRFAAAIAEEGGLRSGEICRIRIPDIDVLGRKVFVRLPNKSNCERWAFFGEKTKRYYIEWMAERDPECGHNLVLHNSLGHELKTQSLRAEFNRTLCKTYDGKRVNEKGFDRWSTHRLRHTMASKLASAGADAATVMACGGWRSSDVMLGYARPHLRVVQREYHEAMRQAQHLKESSTSKKLISATDLLARRRSATSYAAEGRAYDER